MKRSIRSTILTFYQKHTKFAHVLFFVSGLVLAGLYISPPITGGFFRYEMITMCIELLVFIVLFYYTAFCDSLINYTFNNSSIAEGLISLVFAAIVGTQVSLRFFRVFFAEILNGGNSPSLVWKVYKLLPFSSSLNGTLIYAFCFIFGLLAILALFILFLYAIRMLRITVQYSLKHIDYDSPAQSTSLKKRCLVGAVLAVITATLCFFTLHNGQEWGADYALYMRYALHMAQGTPLQMRANWGFPLMLTPIYKVFGYDTMYFTDLIYYKIPGVICLTLLTFILFLFFSKRFSIKWSVIMTSFIGFNPYFINYTNEILTNIPHLLFSMLSIICMQRIFLSKKLVVQITFALLSGLLISITNQIRANGVLLIMAFGCLHITCLACYILRKNRFMPALTIYYPISPLFIHVIPYITYFASTELMYNLVQIPTVASNMLSIAASKLSVPFFEGLSYNASLLGSFLQSIFPLGVFPEPALWIMAPLVLVGMVRCFRKDMLSVIYFLGTLLFFILLQLRQGIRYLFPIIPFLILFLAAGVQAFLSAKTEQQHAHNARIHIIPIITAVCSAVLLCSSIAGAISNMQGGRQNNHQSFSEDAKATYRYIQLKTEENAEIVFFKPEVIKLNTNRESSTTLSDDIIVPTYLLITYDKTLEHQLLPDEYSSVEALESACDIKLDLVYENDLFQLYSVKSSSS